MPAQFADFKAHYGSAPGANQALHVSAHDRYVYFVNPKVACSSIKATLNREEAARTGTELEITSMEDVHARPKMPLLTPRQMGYRKFSRLIADPSATRFSFVRDPVKRFCSAYLSKLAEGKRRSPHYARLRDYMGFKQGYPITLDEFARACAEDDAVRDIDPHWRLQRTQIAWDLVDYSFIGRHDHFAADFSTLSRRLYGAPVEVFDTRSAFGRFTDAPKVSAEISEETRALIETTYEADYDMLSEIDARHLWQVPQEGFITRLRRVVGL